MKQPHFPGTRASQQGIALVVVLILLLVMTLLGIASLRGTLVEERMSAATYDRGLGFQAAEAALREAEALVATNPTFPTGGCSAGLCPLRTNLNTGDLPRWEDPATPWRTVLADLDVDSDGDGTDVVSNPQFIVEAMGPAPNWVGCDRQKPMVSVCMSPKFRVTARSNEADRASVILQSSVSTL